jgi:PAS domain S-box-containing protein
MPLEDQPLVRVQRGETFTGLEVHLKRTDTGEEWWGVYNGTPVRNEEGDTVLSVLTFQDITDRKMAELALRESEATLRSFYDSAPDLMGVVEISGDNIFHVSGNEASRDFFGVMPAGRWASELGMPPEQVSLWLERYRMCQHQGRPVHFEYPFTRNGSVRWLAASVSYIGALPGERPRFSYVANDITTRKRAQAELHYQYRITSAIAQNAADALYLLDPDGRVTFLNPAAEEMFGFSRAEAIGRFLLELIHHSLPITGYEDVLFRKDGTAVDVSCSKAPVFREGKVTAAVLVVHDVSEKKRTEQRLRETQKVESVGLLAGGIAHDFNNLLTGILGTASLMQYDAPEHLRRQLDTIIDASKKAADLTRQLLAYAGKGRFFVQALNLSEVVRSAADLLTPSLPESVSLRLELQPELPLVKADEGQVQQAVINLITNAAEAIGERPQGSVCVSTRVRQVERELMDDIGQRIGPGRYVVIEVVDNGSGLDPATKAKIFDPFFTTKFLGRGLGLAAVAGIMRAQKGGITIRTAPGKGTSFRLLFPVAESEPSAGVTN